MSFTFTTSGACIAKAGASANISGALLAGWSDQAEAVINALTRYDWTANYSSVGANFKGILDDTCSSIVAMNIINYDMSGFTSRLEAQTMLDVLRDNYVRNMESLREPRVQEKLK